LRDSIKVAHKLLISFVQVVVGFNPNQKCDLNQEIEKTLVDAAGLIVFWWGSVYNKCVGNIPTFLIFKTAEDLGY
jgi:hypothetical protein